MNITDTMLIGYSFTPEKDTCVLTVGKKRPNQSVEIINAFIGEEAKDLYKKLTTRNMDDSNAD